MSKETALQPKENKREFTNPDFNKVKIDSLWKAPPNKNTIYII